MALSKSIASYGGIYVDEEAVSNPESQMAANKFNRMAEDTAQMTRVSKKVSVKFQTTTTAATVAVTPTSGRSQWGTGSGQLPTISKTATGTYVITYATSYDDALVGTVADSVSETETLALEYADGVVMDNNDAIVRCTASGNVITAYVRVGGALSDLGGGVTVWVRGE